MFMKDHLKMSKGTMLLDQIRFAWVFYTDKYWLLEGHIWWWRCGTYHLQEKPQRVMQVPLPQWVPPPLLPLTHQRHLFVCSLWLRSGCYLLSVPSPICLILVYGYWLNGTMWWLKYLTTDFIWRMCISVNVTFCYCENVPHWPSDYILWTFCINGHSDSIEVSELLGFFPLSGIFTAWC